MAKIETLRSLILGAGHSDLPVQSTPPALRKRASTVGYEGGATGRRSYGWTPSRLGQNTLLTMNLDLMRSRAREAIRNNAWAAAAIDRFESNVIGTGIQPHWQHPKPGINDQIQSAWTRWIRKADYLGQNDFYTMQAIMAREIFEAGEVFVRYRLRPKSDKLYIPLQLQLIEGEQLPVFRNMQTFGTEGNTVRTGIEFDSQMRRLKYHFYAEHPGESMMYPIDALRFIEVPADQIQHVYRPTRAGQLRGEPRMVSVLALLYELEQYHDAAIVKKKMAAMLAGFIKKPAPEVDLMPPAPINPGSPNTEDPQNPNYSPVPDIGTQVAKLEAGTLQELLPGEDIVWSNLATETDFEPFMHAALHKLAAGMAITYEQLTGDLRGVNYSSIRSGMLEFRRGCEQFQKSVMVRQCCEPIAFRWLDEAVMAGKLDLPGYFKDPEPYRDIAWVGQGWEWVDPLKEAQAAMIDVRAGFDSRAMVVRGKGNDPNTIDAQQVTERKRAAELGLVYDSNPNDVLVGRETQPTIEVDPDPDEQALEELDAGEESSGTGPAKVKKRAVPIPGKVPAAPPTNKPGVQPKPNGTGSPIQ